MNYSSKLTVLFLVLYVAMQALIVHVRELNPDATQFRYFLTVNVYEVNRNL